MLFNSNAFLFLFLPITLLVFFALASRRGSLALGWLVTASFFFYGWWNPGYLVLLSTSIVVGFVLARAATRSRIWLPVGLVFHLGLIAWFKYAGFLATGLERFTGESLTLAPVALPLAISFFTFQQIAFLVDCARGRAGEARFLHYVLFVTFFPQLISGPIVHHREMIPQFEARPRFDWSHFAVGLTFLAIGLFKKTVLADGMAAYTSPIFVAAAKGVPIGLWAGWTAALGYTLQLYFDFSGYSDMAVGLARMFGVRLPLNFHSPLKSGSIIEFWRRWHMTLSRFLRDYLYIPLGGSRRGRLRRGVNLFVTMLLGGLWHGASWTFVFWGGLHGVYLVVNYAFRALKSRLGLSHVLPPALGRPLAIFTTFLAVVVAFVPFRANDLLVSLSILMGMAGVRGVAGRPVEVEAGLWILGLLAIAWGLPNTQQLLRRHDPAIDVYGHLEKDSSRTISWQPTPIWALYTLTLLAASLFAIMVEGHVEFLYRFF